MKDERSDTPPLSLLSDAPNTFEEHLVPMLDVQPPHQSVHTWTGFFIHIGTIVIGLFIAVALEQSVEAINRHSEAAALREDLRQESRQIPADARNSEVPGRMSEHGVVYEPDGCEDPHRELAVSFQRRSTALEPWLSDAIRV